MKDALLSIYDKNEQYHTASEKLLLKKQNSGNSCLRMGKPVHSVPHYALHPSNFRANV
jgi:hypothetical protein